MIKFMQTLAYNLFGQMYAYVLENIMTFKTSKNGI